MKTHQINIEPAQAEIAGRLLAELARRQMEALSLYETLPVAREFHTCRARQRIIRGSNRSGKTLAACVEVARAVTGQDPYKKYPLRDGRCIVLGKDEREIGEVLARKYFRAGAFKMIRDPKSGLWRAYRPWQAWDRENVQLTKPAPPLIPPRLIKSIGWKNKKENIPSKVVLKTGWEMLFLSSKAKPMKGADIDLAHCDEEVVEGSWYEELQARLFDRKGRFIWSVTPEAATEELYALHERAERGDPAIKEFVVRLRENPHFTEEEIDEFARSLSPLMRKAKLDGEYLFGLYRVFPELDQSVHGCVPFAIPEDWTRYLAIDPGRQVCAVVFLAVPPPRHRLGSQVFVYDELYIEASSASKFAYHVAQKVGFNPFEAFLIDRRNAHCDDIGSGQNVGQQYAEALARLKITCARTGSNFLYGSDDRTGRIESVRRWLEIRPDGKATIQIFWERCPKTVDELKRYHYKRDKFGNATDTPVDRNDHTVWGVGALAAFKPPYIKPKMVHLESGVWLAFQRKKKRREEKAGDAIRLGPPV